MAKNLILVDSSVWIDHFRKANTQLQSILEEGLVVTHPFIVGELALGSIRSRSEILTWLQTLPQLLMVNHNEILYFIEQNRLFNQGIGLVDTQLLASCLIQGNALLWTRDKHLNEAANKLNIGFN